MFHFHRKAFFTISLYLSCPFASATFLLSHFCIYMPPNFLSRVSHSADEEWHIGLVTPQQHNERPQGGEGGEGARE